MEKQKIHLKYNQFKIIQFKIQLKYNLDANNFAMQWMNW